MQRSIAGFAGVLCAFAVVAACVNHSLALPERRWSDVATWPAHALPRTGEDVTIPAGVRVLLDVDPPRLGTVRVEGELVATDRDLRLEAAAIAVRGRFAVGRSDRPFAHRANVVLDGTSAARGVLSASEGGRIELFGRRRRTWTRLAATAEPGDTAIELTDPMGWRAGDRVALAPSGFAAGEAEEATLAGVDGAKLYLTAPLRFRHFGDITEGVDERAEIGLLSHDVTVTSDGPSIAARTGGQVVVLAGGTLQASGADFAGLGRAGTLGAYPVHFHHAGDQHASYVADSTIERSFNRCVSIHDSNGIALARDVAYETAGHCFFLEDGDETGNVLDGNLAIAVRVPDPSHTILETDVRPAAFWISNPANTVIANAAAGSAGYGFWYNLPVRAPEQRAGDGTPSPRRTAFGTFARNVAHADEYDGLFVDNLRNPPGVVEAPNYSPPAVATFADFVSYKNRRHGAWLRGTKLRLTNARLADNAIGATFAGADCELSDGIVVGESANRTGPPKPAEPSFPIRGFEFYDGTVGVRDTHFVSFVPNRIRQASALAALRFSPFFTSPRNYASGLSFDRALPVFFERASLAQRDPLGGDGYRSNVFVDRDGSTGGLAGAAIVIDAPLLVDGDCARRPAWNVAICPPAFGSLFVSDLDPMPIADGPLRIARIGTPRGGIVTLHGSPRDTFTTSYQANVRTGERYAVRFLQSFPNHVRVSLRNVETAGDVEVALANAPAGARVFIDGAPQRTERDARGRTLVRLGDRAGVVSADVCVREDCT